MSTFYKKAFTLIELLVVIAIIGILSGLIIVGMNGMTQKATIAKAQVFSNSLRNSLMMNLVSEWKFDNITDYDSGTKVIGTSSNNISDTWGAFGYNHGTASGGPILKDGNDCISGKCIQFDGTDDYVSHVAISFADLDPHTYSVWVKWVTVNPADYVIPFGNGGVSSDVYFAGGSGDKRFRYRASGQSATLASDSDTNLVFNGNWHLVVWTVDSARNVTFYIDGLQNGSATAVSITSAITYSRIGIGYSGTSYPWNGLIDNILVYKSAMPTSQIKELYCAGLNNLLFSGKISRSEYRERINSIAEK